MAASAFSWRHIGAYRLSAFASSRQAAFDNSYRQLLAFRCYAHGGQASILPDPQTFLFHQRRLNDDFIFEVSLRRDYSRLELMVLLQWIVAKMPEAMRAARFNLICRTRDKHQ